jgi:hypothetical protein
MLTRAFSDCARWSRQTRQNPTAPAGTSSTAEETSIAHKSRQCLSRSAGNREGALYRRRASPSARHADAREAERLASQFPGSIVGAPRGSIPTVCIRLPPPFTALRYVQALPALNSDGCPTVRQATASSLKGTLCRHRKAGSPLCFEANAWSPVAPRRLLLLSHPHTCFQESQNREVLTRHSSPDERCKPQRQGGKRPEPRFHYAIRRFRDVLAESGAEK